MVTLGRHVEFRKVTLAALAGTAAAIKLAVNNMLRGADRHILRGKNLQFYSGHCQHRSWREGYDRQSAVSLGANLPLSQIHYARNAFKMHFGHAVRFRNRGPDDSNSGIASL